MPDDALIEALCGLCRAAATRNHSTETVDSWLHYEGRPHVERALARLREDPVIGAAVQGQQFLYLVTGSGTGFGPQFWLDGFLRAAEKRAQGGWADEARSFLSVLRVEGGRVPVQVRTTLAGLKLGTNTAIDLPFGRLRLAQPVDFSASRHRADLPPAAVFEYEHEIPAAVAEADPFTSASGAELRQRVEVEHDRHVARVLLTLALVHDGPVQEHMVWRAPRYTESGSSVNAPPVAPIVAEWPYEIASGPRLDRLVETAEAIADISMDHLTVAVRRYLVARAERTRPTDQIVDYVIAIESMTGVGGGPPRGRALADLIASTPSDADDVEADHKRLTDLRNDIIHEGATPVDAPEVARLGRELVRRGLDALVRRELDAKRAERAGSSVAHG
jgi:hypothetical protein